MRPGRSWRWRPARSDPRSAGRARLCRAGPPPSGRRPRGLGVGRSRRKAAGRRDRRRQRGARSDRPRSARRHSGARRRLRRGIERFRPPPRRRGARHSLDRDFRPDQPMALGAAQSARRDRRDQRATLPAGPATSRYAGSSTTAACATSRRRRSSPPPAARSTPSPPPRDPAARHNDAFIKSA